jgi:protein-L-isoaspartate(D-aspartate) O-methyltransferase
MVRAQLRGRGIRDEAVLAAMETTPRELFVPPDLADQAYADRALPLGSGQTISQPYMVARMTEALEPRPGDRVLEVGTGSGYQAAVLSRLVDRVYSVERKPELAEGARERLARMGVENVEIRVADGSGGWPEKGPYQGIVVTAAAPEVPEALVEQLDPDGGRLVIPVGDRSLQQLTRVKRTGDDVETAGLLACRFVPLLGEGGWS